MNISKTSFFVFFFLFQMINGDSFPPDYQLLAPHSNFDENDKFIFEPRILPIDSDKIPSDSGM